MELFSHILHLQIIVMERIAVDEDYEKNEEFSANLASRAQSSPSAKRVHGSTSADERPGTSKEQTGTNDSGKAGVNDKGSGAQTSAKRVRDSMNAEERPSTSKEQPSTSGTSKAGVNDKGSEVQTSVKRVRDSMSAEERPGTSKEQPSTSGTSKAGVNDKGKGKCVRVGTVTGKGSSITVSDDMRPATGNGLSC